MACLAVSQREHWGRVNSTSCTMRATDIMEQWVFARTEAASGSRSSSENSQTQSLSRDQISLDQGSWHTQPACLACLELRDSASQDDSVQPSIQAANMRYIYSQEQLTVPDNGKIPFCSSLLCSNDNCQRQQQANGSQSRSTSDRVLSQSRAPEVKRWRATTLQVGSNSEIRKAEKGSVASVRLLQPAREERHPHRAPPRQSQKCRHASHC